MKSTIFMVLFVSMNLSGENLSNLPAHMQFPDIWRVGQEPNPELLADYLAWLASDDERLRSAVDSMQWIPVGINILTVGSIAARGEVVESLQLNFYHPEIKGNEGAHAHAKDARTIWYAGANTRQVITREMALPIAAPRLSGVPVEERVAVANSLVDYGDGRRPGYRPIILGDRLVVKQSISSVAPLGWQSFKSTEVHSIAFEGNGVAVSAHYKGGVEPDQLSSFEGLTHYKGLTPDEAAMVAERRSEIGDSLESGNLGPVTMLYPTPDFRTSDMEAEASSTPPELAEELILGGLHTAQQLAA